MLGEAQLRWLMESLRSSNATFKIVASGSQMINTQNAFEAFISFLPNVIDCLQQISIE